jgi:Sec-independent protein translocase protein TatA
VSNIESGLTVKGGAAKMAANTSIKVGSEFGLWGVLDDLTDPIGDVADGMVSVIHLVPGVDWTGEQLKDFAKTGVGEWALRIVATYGYYVAAPYLGAQMASVSFAMPGLLKAEPFLESWIKETMDRVIKTVEILIQTKLPELGKGAGKAANEAFKKFLAENPSTAELFDKLMAETTKGVNSLKDKLGKDITDKIEKGAKDALNSAVEKLGAEYGYPPDFARIAKDAGIREDSAAAAYDLIAKTNYQGKIAWDARTGQDIMQAIKRAKSSSVQSSSMTAHTKLAAKDKRFTDVQSGLTSARTKNLDARRKWVDHYLSR